MSKKENQEQKKMTVTVLGHEVVLQFAKEANPQVALQVKQALLGTYLMTVK